MERRLPRTPRINDTIEEYYEKFGKYRNLEKFLRINSPAGSEAISSNSSCEALAAKMAANNPLVASSSCCKSMPNIHENEMVQFCGSGGTLKDILVDINIELEDDAVKIFSNSSENLHTPKKAGNGVAIQEVKTPDSIAKTHRRLEWDSLGDIGYKKSMSTSNISVLERSLLKEFFKESSVTSEPATTKLHDEQKILEDKPQSKKLENKQLENMKSNAMEHATPPLACSTLVEGLSANVKSRGGARPKMLTKSTSSTSLQEKFEKYAQTSMVKPAPSRETQSQEIQVSLCSSTSVIEGTATPSSFEYYSSRSSKSRSSISSVAAGTSSNLSNVSIPPSAQHPFITSITDLLRKRKALNEKSIQSRKPAAPRECINDLKNRFQAALEENKENQSHANTTTASSSNSFSMTRQAPELDLGIQLICSLIDAKKVNEKQKKKLIRDIVKRLTRLVDEQSAVQEQNSVRGDSTSSNKSNLYDAVYSRLGNGSSRSIHEFPNNNVRASKARAEERSLGLKSLDGNGSYNQCLSHMTVNSTSEQDGSRGKPRNDNGRVVQPHTGHMKSENLCDKSQQTNTLNTKTTSTSPPPTNILNENHKQVPITTIATKAMKHIRDVQSELITETKDGTSNSSKNSTEMSKKLPKTANSAKTASTASSETNASKTTGTTSTSSRSSHDLPTQKTVRKNPPISTYDTDGDQATMREWLNPLTQSEIEYEEKKREESKKKKQLNWIESEIHRLECLKHLLLKDQQHHHHDNTSSVLMSSDQSSVPLKETFNSSTQHTDKLYDSVYSDKSSVLSESAERLVKEIEVILEESNEDVLEYNNNPAKGAVVENEFELHINIQKTKHKHKEEENCGHKHDEKPIQRQKIDTPPSAGTADHSPAEGGESLRDMVKQRKQEFMASYKTKKQNHYDILKQQQKVEAGFKYLPIHAKERQQGYYSVPHTMNRRFSPTEYAYPQSDLPPTPQEINTNNSSSGSSHVIYSTATTGAFQKRPELPKPSTSVTTSNSTTTTTASSASIFCMSSDCSVPMGSKNCSSTPTTTHHYDDVAAAVAGCAQTSDLYHGDKHQLQPYIRRQCPLPLKDTIPNIVKAAAIQVKPKGIAYVIEFDNTKEMNNNNSCLKNNDDNLQKSTSTFTTNNLKCLEKEGPQLTLQEHLERSKPNFLKHSKERKAILNKLQSMRQERDRQLRDIIDNTSFNSLERRLKYLPPPPMQKLRILKTKEMKALTNKRVASLPEVVARKQQELEEKRRRGNRILRDVFNLRLQKRVRSGKLSLNHSKVVV
ncbi:centrosome-associated protein Alms1a-like [Musca vetustissima]|uniref:centrosome-associated protein Alms1a-like n=1 Tax=Musca vetustissima TaxID=27455 RepID=UPI002AB78AD1|nr:centrosome-associated protein Alms1a-like [Musca vetustissima]